MARHGAKVEPRAREALVAQLVQARKALVADGLPELEKQLGRFSLELDKSVGLWRRQSLMDLVLGIGKLLAIAVLIRTAVVEPFKIPSGSMIPTLAVGDQVFVNKFIYGVRIPWINKVPFVLVRPPARGDVIVFNNPMDESVDFIKRVVGLPGDILEVRGEILFINGQVQPRTTVAPETVFYNQTQDASATWRPQPSALYEEKLGTVMHAVVQSSDHPKGTLREGAYEVPEGHVFVMGDNRDNSTDSRYGLGGAKRSAAYVPFGHIKGKAMVIWLSLSYDGLFSQYFGGTGLRTDRFFLPVR